MGDVVEFPTVEAAPTVFEGWVPQAIITEMRDHGFLDGVDTTDADAVGYALVQFVEYLAFGAVHYG